MRFPGFPAQRIVLQPDWRVRSKARRTPSARRGAKICETEAGAEDNAGPTMAEFRARVRPAFPRRAPRRCMPRGFRARVRADLGYPGLSAQIP